MHLVRTLTARFLLSRKVSLFAATLLAAIVVPMLSDPIPSHAVTDCSPNAIVTGGEASSWLNGGGVNVCTTGDDSNNYVNNINGVSTLTGFKWECVELVNRLYLTKGWITANWLGNGNTLINNVPSGLTAQNNGAISYVNPGDVITLDNGGNGHAAIINTVNGTTVNIINQNAPLNSSASITAGSLSTGNAHYNSSWFGYTVQAIVHAPSVPQMHDPITFGNSTDTPITGDWADAGITNVGVWRSGVFYLRNVDGSSTSITFGNSTDTPITGDWDNNGSTDVGVWRAGTFYLRHPDGTSATITFGNSTDTPISGHWSGPGPSQVGVWRAGTFYLRQADGTFSTIAFGNSTDTPITGDWDNNGSTDVGVWRAGTFYLRHPDSTYATIVFGDSTDTPTIGDWNGAGASQVGVWRSGVFYFNN